MIAATTPFQDAIEKVEQLPVEEQVELIDVIYRRLVDQRRDELALIIAEGRLAYRTGAVNRGSVDDLLAALDE